MYKSIILAFVVVFFVIGIVTVISYLLIKAACPDKKTGCFILCPFYGDDRECSVKISCIISILTALGFAKRCTVVAVDCGMKKNEKELLYSAFAHCPNIKLCDADDIAPIIKNKSERVP